MFSVTALLLLAFLGWSVALAMYDLTSIYGDPTGSALSMFGTFAVVPAVAALLAGNHYGLQDKLADTSVAPSCGIQNPDLSGSSASSSTPATSGAAVSHGRPR
ncbi:MAG TPA: hypothetical protein VFR87_10155 [Nocardioidaceae bacterium]|nr:hypothetical protein [Nocardioidaceae bacterium]